MLAITLSMHSPPLEQINAMLERVNQPKLSADQRKTPERRWLGAINSPEAKDHITVTVLAVGIPTTLSDLSVLLDQVGVELAAPMRLYTLPLSSLEDRLARFKSEPHFLSIVQQLSSLLINNP